MTDARAFNRMDPETKAVHVRLERWGNWAKEGNQNGWPAQTILGRMMEQGPNGASQHGKPPISMPEDIAVTDAAVAKLGEVDKGVIRAYYIRWAPMEVIWKECRGIHSVANFKCVLKRARWRIAGYVDAIAA